MVMDDTLATADKAIFELIEEELHRQQEGIELIASENFTSVAVLQAMGSVLTNKYAEGLPGKRYYGGCEVVDKVEQLAIERLKALFGCDHANVQPHSGAQANIAAFMAAGLAPGDTILGQDLSNGGHLTHGSPVNFSGMYYTVASYKVDSQTHRIDMNRVREAAQIHRPKLIICGASAYSRVIDFKAFRDIADEVGALLMADIAHIAGLVAAGVHPSPVPYAHIVTTTTHKTLRGPRGGVIMCQEPFAKAIDKAVLPGLQGGPLMHVIAGKAVAFKEAATDEFKAYAKQIVANAQAMAGILKDNELDLLTDGTDNHLMMLNLVKNGMTGKAGSTLLDEIALTVNKNTVPDDPQSPFVTSGIRLGTPAVTTRGMREAQMQQIGQAIADALLKRQPAERLRKEMLGLASQFPLYPNLGRVKVAS